MRCRDFESLLIKTSEKNLEPTQEKAMTEHADGCVRCQRRMVEWQKIKSALPGLAAPPLPAELDEKVQALCHAEIRRISPSPAGLTPEKSPALPAFFWPVFAALVLLTVALLVPGLRALVRGGSWTLPAILAVALIVQNGLMLLFAPLLLTRRPENGTWCG